jgi:hypothetical protein
MTRDKLRCPLMTQNGHDVDATRRPLMTRSIAILRHELCGGLLAPQRL